MASKFKVVTHEPDILRESINTVANLLNEGVFKISKTGIELKSMDSANVALVDLHLLATGFKEFEVEKEIEIGVNIADLTSVLRRAKATDSITLELKDNTLNISFSGNIKRSFNIPLLDLRQESKTPNLDFPVSIELKTHVIEDGISDAEIVSDAVILEADPDMFIMRAEGDLRKTELKLEKGDESLVGLNAKDHVKSTFPLDYLRRMVKAAKISESTKISLGNDYPMRMDFNVENKVALSFILAPRIENE